MTEESQSVFSAAIRRKHPQAASAASACAQRLHFEKCLSLRSVSNLCPTLARPADRRGVLCPESRQLEGLRIPVQEVAALEKKNLIQTAGKAAEALDLPADLAADRPGWELIGWHELRMEKPPGILGLWSGVRSTSAGET